MQGDLSPASAFTVNTLGFNTAGRTLTVSGAGNSIVTSGGVHATANGGGSSIVAGAAVAAITSGTSADEVVIHNYGSLTLGVPVVNNGETVALTHAATGTTTLNAAMTNTKGTTVNSGTLKLGEGGEIGAAALVVRMSGTFGERRRQRPGERRGQTDDQQHRQQQFGPRIHRRRQPCRHNRQRGRWRWYGHDQFCHRQQRDGASSRRAAPPACCSAVPTGFRRQPHRDQRPVAGRQLDRGEQHQRYHHRRRGGPDGQLRSMWIAHGKLCNVLFIDGHAEPMTAKQLQKELGIMARWDYDRVQRTNAID